MSASMGYSSHPFSPSAVCGQLVRWTGARGEGDLAREEEEAEAGKPGVTEVRKRASRCLFLLGKFKTSLFQTAVCVARHNSHSLTRFVDASISFVLLLGFMWSVVVRVVMNLVCDVLSNMREVDVAKRKDYSVKYKITLRGLLTGSTRLLAHSRNRTQQRALASSPYRTQRYIPSLIMAILDMACRKSLLGSKRFSPTGRCEPLCRYINIHSRCKPSCSSLCR